MTTLQWLDLHTALQDYSFPVDFHHNTHAELDNFKQTGQVSGCL